MTTTLDTLFNPKNQDAYKIQPGDELLPAQITVADWKEAQLAINVCHRRIMALLADIERLEQQEEG